MKRKTLLAAVGVAATVMLAACGGGSAASGAGGSTSTTYTFATVFQPTTWDPAKADPTTAGPFFEAVYDTLLIRDGNAKIQPGLATKWKYNKDQTQLTLTLRTGVTFTDGEKLDAAAVVANLEHYRDADGPSTSDLASVRDIKAVGADSVVLTLTSPDPALVEHLATAVGYMAAPNAIKGGHLGTTPVGSGPYTLDTAHTVPGSKYVFKANPKTWRHDVYQTIDISYMPDPNAALNALKAGQVNAAMLTDLQAAAAAQQAGFQRIQFSPSTVGLFIFDRDGKITPALKDVRVRQAINYAVDAKALVDAFLGGTKIGTLTRQSFGPDSDAWDPSLDSAYPYDPGKAKQLLAEAGYPNGFTVTMPYYTLLGTGVLDSLKEMLGKVGITVKYDQMAPEDVQPALLAGKYSMSLLTEFYDNDWTTMTTYFTPDAPFNPFHVQDPAIDGLIRDYQFASDSQRPAIAKKVNENVVDQAWTDIWAYGQPSILVNSKAVKVSQSNFAGFPSLFNFASAS
ncbi:MAG: ABC transporter substrate-binding protein [Trebonia sp.]